MFGSSKATISVLAAVGPVCPPAARQETFRELVARMGFEPDEVQEKLLGWWDQDVILNCTRQWGKSTVAAAMAVARAWLEPGMTVLVLGPTEGQAGELVGKAKEFAERLAGETLKRHPRRKCSVVLPNGSRILALPDRPTNIRCYTASLLVVDEAAHFTSDVAYDIVRPALAVKNGKTWLLSTSGPTRGFFYKAWTAEGDGWLRVQVKAADCPRLSEEFLEKERKMKTPELYAREYECVFGSDEGAIFEEELLERAMVEDGEQIRF